MTLTLYYISGSRGHRISWLLEELNVPFEIKPFYRDSPLEPAPQEFKDASPTEESPTLVDGDKVLVESAYIMDYVMRKYGKNSPINPQNDKEIEDVKYAMYSAEANFMTAAVQLVIFKLAPTTLPPIISFIVGAVLGQVGAAWAIPETRKQLAFLEKQIKANKGFYTGGHLTPADIIYEYNVYMVDKFGVLPTWREEFPALAEWQSLLSNRPAYKRANERENSGKSR